MSVKHQPEKPIIKSASAVASSNPDDEIEDEDLIDPSVVIEPPPEMKS